MIMGMLIGTFWRLHERASEFVSTVPHRFARVGVNRGFVRNFTILSGGSTLAQGFSIAMAPLITRLYLPHNFGQLALFAAFLNVAIVAVSLRYEFAIVSARDDREAAQLTLGSFLLALPVSAFAGLIFYVLVRKATLGYGNMPLYAAVLVTPALILTSIFTALRYWLLRKERFNLISHGTILQNAGRALAQAGLGLLGPYTGGLLAGEIIGRCAGLSRMLRSAGPALGRDLAGSSFRQLIHTLNRNRHFAVYALPSSILDTVGSSMTLPLIVLLYGINAGGSYALVSRVLDLPAVLITANVADAFHSRAALISQQDPAPLPGLVKHMAAILLFAGLVPAAILIAFGPQLFKWVFGSKWTEAGVMAAWLAPWFVARFVVNPLTRVVLVVGRQRIKFIYDIFILTSTIVVFLVAHYCQWPVTMAIAALAAVNTAAYLIFYILLLNISSAHVRAPRPVVAQLP